MGKIWVGGPQQPAPQGKQDPPSWSLPDTDRCVIAKCTVRPKHGPLCGRHSQHAQAAAYTEFGARTSDITHFAFWMHQSRERVRNASELEPLVPEFSDAGWAWVMSLAEAQVDGDQPGPEYRLVAAAVASQAAVSRVDTMTLLDTPGWARYRLRAPWVADELVLALADHSRPVEDRRTVAMSGYARTLPNEAYALVATDPDADVRLAAARSPLPDDVRSLLIADDDDRVAASALDLENDVQYRFLMSGRSAMSPLMTSPARLERLLRLADGEWSRTTRDNLVNHVDLSVLLRAEQLPTWVAPNSWHPEHLQRTAAGYVAYASPTTAVRDTAMALLSDGWDQALPALVSAACALEGEPAPA